MKARLWLHLGQGQRQLTDGLVQPRVRRRGRAAPPLQPLPGHLVENGRALVVGRAVVSEGIHFGEAQQDAALQLRVEGEPLVFATS